MTSPSFKSKWNRRRLKYIGIVTMGQSPPSETIINLSGSFLPFLQGTAEFGKTSPKPKFSCSSPKKIATQDSLLVSVRAPVGELNIADQDYSIGRGLCAVRWVGIYPRFGWWAIHHHRRQLEKVATGSTYQAVAASDVGNIFLDIPATEQLETDIADFLDREVGRIDTLVQEKEKMLDLIREKRSTQISHVVTRGLNPDVPFKESGLAWLGNVPSHWDIKRSKRLLRERDERSVTGVEELLTVSHITGVTKRSEKDVNMFEAESNKGYKKCYPGDLVINTLWAWMGAMGVAWEGGIVSPAYHVYQLGKELLPEYIDALVRIPVFAKEVTRFSKGVWSSRLRLYPEGLYEVWLPVPPIGEQKEIIASISDEQEQTAELESELKKSIILLNERRSALITAAVTGQLDPKEMTDEN